MSEGTEPAPSGATFASISDIATTDVYMEGSKILVTHGSSKKRALAAVDYGRENYDDSYLGFRASTYYVENHCGVV